MTHFWILPSDKEWKSIASFPVESWFVVNAFDTAHVNEKSENRVHVEVILLNG